MYFADRWVGSTRRRGSRLLYTDTLTVHGVVFERMDKDDVV